VKAEIISQNSGVYIVDKIDYFSHYDWNHQKPNSITIKENILDQMSEFPFKIHKVKITTVVDHCFEGQQPDYRKNIYILRCS
jgi:hypothetical protein